MALDELMDLVDKNDVVIGQKNRESITSEEIYRMTIIWVEDGKGNVLIHKRVASKKKYPSCWENAAGGGVLSGESYEQAAIRELEEEIGIANVVLTPVAKTPIETEGGIRFCQWFKAIIDLPLESFTPEPREVAELKWIKKSYLLADRDANPDKYMPSSAYWRELFS
jgi:isopentenyldiphosphate isomerase